MFLVLRRDVVQPVEIRNGLGIGLVLDQLFRAPVQQTDMRVRALDHFAVHFQDQAQHAVGRRVLRTEVQVEILDLGFGHGQDASVSGSASAFSSPGSTTRSMPSQGLSKSKLRNSWVSFTGS